VTTAPLGVLLVNLGTPDAARPREVRRYLREFLSDPRVIDIPAPLRWLLLEAVILPTRPRKSAAAYAKIWTPQGSPLLLHGRALRDAVAAELGPGYAVALGMRYAEPSLASALATLRAARAREILLLPLFPQYSEAATGSVLARVRELARAEPSTAPIRPIESFWADRGFVSAWVENARSVLDAFRPDHVLFSYHGLPERQVRAADPSGRHCLASEHCCAAIEPVNQRCYRAQCFATTRAIAAGLALPDARYSSAFQSRLGRTPWIQPYTDQVLDTMAAQGVKRVAVLCPAFVADCLETLEEIGLRAEARWRERGGEALALLPSLNAQPRWVRAVADLLRGAADA
jgi:protoporphyrin/coproporphyrin ferrochelatase